MTRETICSRIDNNIRSLGIELEQLRRDRDEATQRLDTLRQRQTNLIDDQTGPGPGVGRRPTRPSRVGNGIDITGALGQVIGNDRSARIRQSIDEIRRREMDLRDIAVKIGNKERLLQKEQDDFVQLECHQLGFSHEVLNIHSADKTLHG